jgi:hypothetical protein
MDLLLLFSHSFLERRALVSRWILMQFVWLFNSLNAPMSANRRQTALAAETSMHAYTVRVKYCIFAICRKSVVSQLLFIGTRLFNNKCVFTYLSLSLCHLLLPKRDEMSHFFSRANEIEKEEVAAAAAAMEQREEESGEIFFKVTLTNCIMMRLFAL